MGWLTIGIISLLGGGIGMALTLSGQSPTSDIAVVIVLIVVGLLCIPLYLRSKKRKTQRQEQKAAAAQRIADEGIVTEDTLILVDGLPLAEGTACILQVKEDSLNIQGAGQTFQLTLEQIIAAQAKSDVEIEKEVTSSLGKGVVGGFLFGPIGAIVGARAKTKTTRKTTYYLVINYTNQSGNTAVLSFEWSVMKPCKSISDAITVRIRSLRADNITNL